MGVRCQARAGRGGAGAVSRVAPISVIACSRRASNPFGDCPTVGYPVTSP
jgi:hypothetical protein